MRRTGFVGSSILNGGWERTVLLLCFCLFCVLPTRSYGARSMEYEEIQAGFIYNFIPFTSWPVGSFTDQEGDFIIGIVGNKGLTRLFREVEGESVSGKILKVENIDPFTESERLGSCHILFLHDSLGQRIPEILTMLEGSSILTISNRKGFAGQGGMIEFFEKNGRVRFIINLGNAKDAGLEFRAQLLRVASLVLGGNHEL